MSAASPLPRSSSAPPDPVQPERERRPFLARLRTDLGEASARPLAILFLLNMVDEFDRSALLLLLPEIQRDFSLSDTAAGALLPASLLGILFAPLIGHLASKGSRVRFVWSAPLVWSALAFATPFAPSFGVLLAVRLGNGVAKAVNDSVHPSLLSDYYPAAARGRVFAVHQSANSIAWTVGPAMAGTLAWMLDWRAAFVLMTVPSLFLAFAAARLREPPRWTSDAPDLPLLPVVRALRRVPTLRRDWLATFVGGAGGIAYHTYVSLFLGKELHAGPLIRGAFNTLGGAAMVAGFVFSGILADRRQRRSDFKGLPVLSSVAIAAFGLGVPFVAASPNFFVASIVLVLLAPLLGFWIPPAMAMRAAVTPPPLRAVCFGISSFVFTIGGAVGTLLLGIVSDRFGVRWAVAGSGILVACAGALLLTCRKTVANDVLAVPSEIPSAIT